MGGQTGILGQIVLDGSFLQLFSVKTGFWKRIWFGRREDLEPWRKDRSSFESPA